MTFEKPSTTRRTFLRQAIPATAAAYASYAVPGLALDHSTAARKEGPRIALIGAGARGIALAAAASRFGRLVAVADVDLAQGEKARQALESPFDLVQDYRRVLDRSDVDVVINATPDHWHTAINIDACNAAKDVYTEKPLTLTIEEGQLLKRVVAATGRVMQVGTNQRSGSQFRTAVELVKQGRIGPLQRVAIQLPFWSAKGGPFAAHPIPKTLDWNAYQGQAAKQPYCPERTHFYFRYWWEYAGGICCDWGHHHVDIAHWAMGVGESGPLTVEARCLFPNRGAPQHFNNPDRFTARLEYPGQIRADFFVVRDERYLASMNQGDIREADDAWLFAGVSEELRREQRNGIMFVGSEGRIFVNRGGLYGAAVEALDDLEDRRRDWQTDPTLKHVENFFECVESRKTPVANVAEQHRSITACHLTNIAMRVGRTLHWDAAAEQIVGDDEASRWTRREARAPYGSPRL